MSKRTHSQLNAGSNADDNIDQYLRTPVPRPLRASPLSSLPDFQPDPVPVSMMIDTTQVQGPNIIGNRPAGYEDSLDLACAAPAQHPINLAEHSFMQEPSLQNPPSKIKAKRAKRQPASAQPAEEEKNTGGRPRRSNQDMAFQKFYQAYLADVSSFRRATGALSITSIVEKLNKPADGSVPADRSCSYLSVCCLGYQGEIAFGEVLYQEMTAVLALLKAIGVVRNHTLISYTALEDEGLGSCSVHISAESGYVLDKTWAKCFMQCLLVLCSVSKDILLSSRSTTFLVACSTSNSSETSGSPSESTTFHFENRLASFGILTQQEAAKQWRRLMLPLGLNNHMKANMSSDCLPTTALEAARLGAMITMIAAKGFFSPLSKPVKIIRVDDPVNQSKGLVPYKGTFALNFMKCSMSRDFSISSTFPFVTTLPTQDNHTTLGMPVLNGYCADYRLVLPESVNRDARISDFPMSVLFANGIGYPQFSDSVATSYHNQSAQLQTGFNSREHIELTQWGRRWAENLACASRQLYVDFKSYQLHHKQKQFEIKVTNLKKRLANSVLDRKNFDTDSLTSQIDRIVRFGNENYVSDDEGRPWPVVSPFLNICVRISYADFKNTLITSEVSKSIEDHLTCVLTSVTNDPCQLRAASGGEYHPRSQIYNLTSFVKDTLFKGETIIDGKCRVQCPMTGIPDFTAHCLAASSVFYKYCQVTNQVGNQHALNIAGVNGAGKSTIARAGVKILNLETGDAGLYNANQFNNSYGPKSGGFFHDDITEAEWQRPGFLGSFKAQANIGEQITLVKLKYRNCATLRAGMLFLSTQNATRGHCIVADSEKFTSRNLEDLAAILRKTLFMNMDRQLPGPRSSNPAQHLPCLRYNRLDYSHSNYAYSIQAKADCTLQDLATSWQLVSMTLLQVVYNYVWQGKKDYGFPLVHVELTSTGERSMKADTQAQHNQILDSIIYDLVEQGDPLWHGMLCQDPALDENIKDSRRIVEDYQMLQLKEYYSNALSSIQAARSPHAALRGQIKRPDTDDLVIFEGHGPLLAQMACMTRIFHASIRVHKLQLNNFVGSDNCMPPILAKGYLGLAFKQIDYEQGVFAPGPDNNFVYCMAWLQHRVTNNVYVDELALKEPQNLHAYGVKLHTDLKTLWNKYPEYFPRYAMPAGEPRKWLIDCHRHIDSLSKYSNTLLTYGSFLSDLKAIGFTVWFRWQSLYFLAGISYSIDLMSTFEQINAAFFQFFHKIWVPYVFKINDTKGEYSSYQHDYAKVFCLLVDELATARRNGQYERDLDTIGSLEHMSDLEWLFAIMSFNDLIKLLGGWLKKSVTAQVQTDTHIFTAEVLEKIQQYIFKSRDTKDLYGTELVDTLRLLMSFKNTQTCVPNRTSKSRVSNVPTSFPQLCFAYILNMIMQAKIRFLRVLGDDVKLACDAVRVCQQHLKGTSPAAFAHPNGHYLHIQKHFSDRDAPTRGFVPSLDGHLWDLYVFQKKERKAKYCCTELGGMFLAKDKLVEFYNTDKANFVLKHQSRYADIISQFQVDSSLLPAHLRQSNLESRPEFAHIMNLQACPEADDDSADQEEVLVVGGNKHCYKEEDIQKKQERRHKAGSSAQALGFNDAGQERERQQPQPLVQRSPERQRGFDQRVRQFRHIVSDQGDSEEESYYESDVQNWLSEEPDTDGEDVDE